MLETVLIGVAAVFCYFVYAAVTFTPAKPDEEEDRWWKAIK